MNYSDCSLSILLEISPFLQAGFIVPAIGMIILLVVSALISGSEVAFFSMKPVDLEELRMSSEPSSERIISLLEMPDRNIGSRNLLATILVVNNLVNIVIILLSTSVVSTLVPPGSLSPLLEAIIHIATVTFLIVLFGEVIPKVYATNYGMKLAKIMSLPLQISQRIFWVLWKPLVSLGGLLDKRNPQSGNNISVEELGHALQLTDSAQRSSEEKRILEGIITFGTKDVKQIMTSRVDMEALPTDFSFEEVNAQIVQMGFSRIPVYKGSVDEIAGILYIKDLLPHLDNENFEWQSIIRLPFFVPEKKKIDDMLREFQERKNHMAIVVDEYGGTSGLVTLEDVIEEIVGDITDEFDDEDLQYSKLDDLNYVFEGKTALIDIYRVLEIDGADFEGVKGESDTLAGFIIEQAGKIPHKGERTTFGDFTFTIESADKRKIKRVKITLLEKHSE